MLDMSAVYTIYFKIMLKELFQILGKYIAFLAAALLFPLALALYDRFTEAEPFFPDTTLSFIYAILIALTFSGLFLFLGRKAKGLIGRRESILLVALIWIITSLISALPFYFSKTLSPINAYFEAMSGLTTTGATVMTAKAYDPNTGQETLIHNTNPHIPTYTYSYYGTIEPIRDPSSGLILHTGIEAVSRPLLLWRSFLQWVGGMGIVVIFLTVLPALGVGGKFLYQMEVTGPFKEEITPRIHQTVSYLWKLYLFFTALEIALLLWADPKIDFFDSLCLSLSNISTGGFSIYNNSLVGYHSDAVQWIVVLFMILGSINFALYFHIIRLKLYRLYVPDFILFIAILLFGALSVSLFLIGQPHYAFTDLTGLYSLGTAFKDGIFQAISLQTSSGFVVANYDLWPFSAQMILFLLMYVGGMSGSTSGGIKTSRFYILYRIVLNRLESLYRPDSVRKLKIGNAEVDDKHALTALGFFCIVGIFTVIGTGTYILHGVDPESALALTVSLTNNVGASFRAAGPDGSLGFLSNFEKFLSTFWMLLGRLEYYVVLLLLLPSYWKGR